MTTIRNNNQSNGGTKAPIDLKSEFAKQINGGVKTDSEGAALLSASDPSAGRFLSWQESGKTTAWLDDGKLWKRKLDDTKSIADSNGDGVTDILGLDAAKPGKTVVKTFNRDGQSQDSEQDLGVPWEDGKQIVELDHIFADVNGDGKTDIVAFGQRESYAAYVAYGTGNAGAPFSRPTTLTLDSGSRGPSSGAANHAAVDIDGDGDVDLVSLDDGALIVAHNKGNGTFERPLYINGLTSPGALKNGSLQIGDRDGDGKLEAFTDTRSASIDQHGAATEITPTPTPGGSLINGDPQSGSYSFGGYGADEPKEPVALSATPQPQAPVSDQQLTETTAATDQAIAALKDNTELQEALKANGQGWIGQWKGNKLVKGIDAARQNIGGGAARPGADVDVRGGPVLSQLVSNISIGVGNSINNLATGKTTDDPDTPINEQAAAISSTIFDAVAAGGIAYVLARSKDNLKDKISQNILSTLTPEQIARGAVDDVWLRQNVIEKSPALFTDTILGVADGARTSVAQQVEASIDAIVDRSLQQIQAFDIEEAALRSTKLNQREADVFRFIVADYRQAQTDANAATGRLTRARERIDAAAAELNALALRGVDPDAPGGSPDVQRARGLRESINLDLREIDNAQNALDAAEGRKAALRDETQRKMPEFAEAVRHDVKQQVIDEIGDRVAARSAEKGVVAADVIANLGALAGAGVNLAGSITSGGKDGKWDIDEILAVAGASSLGAQAISDVFENIGDYALKSAKFASGAKAAAGVFGLGANVLGLASYAIGTEGATGKSAAYRGAEIGLQALGTVLQGAHAAVSLLAPLSNAVPVLGAITSILGAINPSAWDAFEKAQERIDALPETMAGKDLKDLLKQNLTASKVGYGVSTGLSAGFGIAGSVLAATGVGAPVAAVVGLLGAAFGPIIAAIQQASMERKADDKALEILNRMSANFSDISKQSSRYGFSGAQTDALVNAYSQADMAAAVDAIFGTGTAPQTAKQKEATQKLKDAMTKLTAASDKAFAFHGQAVSGEAQSVLAITKLAGNQGATAQNYLVGFDHGASDFDKPIVMDQVSGVLNLPSYSDVDRDGVKEATVTFVSPLFAAGKETSTRNEKGKNNYSTTLKIDSQILKKGWEINDSNNSDTTFNMSQALLRAKPSSSQGVQTLKATINAGDGADKYLGYNNNVTFNGGDGIDSASYSGLDAGNVKSVVFNADASGNVTVAKNLKQAEYYEEKISTRTEKVGKRTEKVEYRNIVLSKENNVTMTDTLTNTEILSGSGGSDVMDLTRTNKILAALTGAGADSIAFARGVELADAGDGDDAITIGGGATQVLQAKAGRGNDTVTLKSTLIQELAAEFNRDNLATRVASGFVIDGGDGTDTLKTETPDAKVVLGGVTYTHQKFLGLLASLGLVKGFENVGKENVALNVSSPSIFTPSAGFIWAQAPKQQADGVPVIELRGANDNLLISGDALKAFQNASAQEIANKQADDMADSFMRALIGDDPQMLAAYERQLASNAPRATPGVIIRGAERVQFAGADFATDQNLRNSALYKATFEHA